MKFIPLLGFYFVSLYHAVISNDFVITLPITHSQPTTKQKAKLYLMTQSVTQNSRPAQPTTHR